MANIDVFTSDKFVSDLDNTQELTAEILNQYNPKWLIEGFVEKNKLINFYGASASGKSLTALYLAVYMLEKEIISKVIYIDWDNGIGTLKNRGLDKLLAKYGDKLTYISSSVKSKTPADPTKLIFAYSNLADESCKDTLIIFDKISCFIKGRRDVIPTLNALRKMRDYYAGVWFQKTQSIQDLTGKNNKAYRGKRDTAFLNICDEVYYVQKTERKESKLTVMLEPMIQIDDTIPQIIIIDTENTSLKFSDYLLDSMSKRESLTIEYAKEVLADKSSGINLQNLVKEIRRKAKIAGAEKEVCGICATKELLKKFAGIFYKMERGEKNNLNFSPLP